MDEYAPFLRAPLSFEHGRMRTVPIEDSIRDNIRLILHNYVQGEAKPEGVAADPEYGAALPHHEFRRGRASEVVRIIRNALRSLEPRLEDRTLKVDYASTKPGRYFPFSRVRVTGKVIATGESLVMDFDIEE